MKRSKLSLCLLLIFIILSCKNKSQPVSDKLDSEYISKMEKIDSLAKYYNLETQGNFTNYSTYWDTIPYHTAKNMIITLGKQKIISEYMFDKNDSIENAVSDQIKSGRIKSEFIEAIQNRNSHIRDSLFSLSYEKLKEVNY